MPKEITIDNHKVGLGEVKEIYLKVARLPTYTSIKLPVHVYRGKEDGPVLLLTGGLHGDELNGIEIIRRMINNGDIMPDKGTVIAVPLVNAYGFLQNERGVPDGKDINRSFPGSKSGSLAMLIAHKLMHDIIPQIDYGVDFHTGGASRANYPQVRCNFTEPLNLELAKAFAPPMILNSSLIDKSFRKAAHKKKKQILVFEAGEAMRFDEHGIIEGIAGTKRLMKHLGMIDSAPEPSEPATIYHKSTWIRAKYAGLFNSEIELGDEIKRRQKLGHIAEPFGHEEFEIFSPRAARVIGLNYAPVMHKGDALMHIAYESKEID